tara:strand:- start:355 stop:789 length:435 start_codon:yes stop_codon:yes gene_type:complete
MGFKLGKRIGNHAIGGEINKKMRFGRQAGDADISVPGTPVIRTQLEEGVLGEANIDGSIYINKSIIPGSFEERQVINHEMRHVTDIKTGKLSYADDHVMYNGERFERRDINGVDSILVDGTWKEAGDTGFPWEDDANNGNNEYI